MLRTGLLASCLAAVGLLSLPAAALPPGKISSTRSGRPPTTGTTLLRNAGGESARYTGIGQLRASLTCTAWVVDLPGRGRAYAIANGHCSDLSPTTTLVDAPARGATLELLRFVDTKEKAFEVPIARIAWSSMKGVELGIFELEATLAELRAKGARPLRIAARPPAAEARVENVGNPVVGVPQDQQYLRRSSCTTGSRVPRLVEERWVWNGAIPNDCRGITGGSSGSPLLDRATGEVYGAINTTTYLAERLTPCYWGRPCEVRDGSLRAVANRSYAIPVSGLRACFTSQGRFRLGGSCPLDTRSWLQVTTPSVGVNPDVPGIFGKPQTTWDAELSGAGLTHYRTKVGSAGTTDCRVARGYGAPVALARTPGFDAALPQKAGRWALCVLAGPGPKVDGRWQPPANATTVVRYVDRTPPSRAIVVAVDERPSASGFEPIFDLPEQAQFTYKVGPAAATDCADLEGYLPYRRQEIRVRPEQHPARACIRSWDEAGNEATSVWTRVIDGVA